MMSGVALKQRLLETLGGEVEVVDISGGCGSSFEVYVVSDCFQGKRLLERHKMVNEAVASMMSEIHALSIKKTKTPVEDGGEQK